MNSNHVIDQASGDRWAMYHGDSVEILQLLPAHSVGYSIFSPPFKSLYTYSNSPRDIGNCRNDEEFSEHFRFIIDGLRHIMMPGRNVSVHCMLMPTSKAYHGYIGLDDFRGDLIRAVQGKEAAELHACRGHLLHRAMRAEVNGDTARALQLRDMAAKIQEELKAHPGDAGFIYHSEVCIWKDPVTAMQRTKALGLLHKTVRGNASMSRQGVPDYLVTFRAPGECPKDQRVTHDAAQYPVDLWQRIASPVWMDIDQGDTLQCAAAREHDDERHICPLQLEVIRRGIMLWSNPGDIVLSPFGGIGSEPYSAVACGRRGIGIELKESYYRQAVANLTAQSAQPDLFDMIGDSDGKAA
jgi:hypothetical protein